ncbi:hypothetical protein [Nitrososphaera sp.]|uniref:hypothetical protein n=1 Tax=Nitrososphaera sp. TaxID=1971748 RepID=UPI00307E51EB
MVVGNMVECIPTRGLDVCEPGFRDTRGNYFWLENLYEISEANPGLLTEIPSDDGASGRFVVRGTFTAGDPPHSGVDVAGSIKVTSMTRTGDGAQIIVPD